MLHDSDSPQSDYKKLCSWLDLPETQEVLRYLQDKAEATDRMVHASPTVYRSATDDRSVPMEAGLVQQLRDQFIGEFRGLLELKRTLDQRKLDLETTIKAKENTP